MIPDNATVIAFAPNAPRAEERLVLCDGSLRDRLVRILSALGVTPLLVGFAPAGNDETHLIGRGADGKPAIFARFLYGASAAELEAIRDALVAEGWKPRPPRFDMILPDGRCV